MIARESVPGADGQASGSLNPARLIEAVSEAFDRDRPLRAVSVVGYDLNRDGVEWTTRTVLELVESAARAAGGVPRPETGGGAEG